MTFDATLIILPIRTVFLPARDPSACHFTAGLKCEILISLTLPKTAVSIMQFKRFKFEEQTPKRKRFFAFEFFSI